MAITWEKLQSWLIVTVIAVLVWLYAEGQAVTEQPKQVEVEFVAPGSWDLRIEPGSVSVTATFSASASQMRQVESLLRAGPMRVEVRPPDAEAVYDETMRLRDILMGTELGQLGVNIVEVTPATARVTVEPLVTREAEVRVEVEPGFHVQRPRVEPRAVELTVPASLADLAQREPVRAVLTELGTFAVDEEQTVQVMLELPQALRARRWVRMQPQTATVTFTITRQTETLTLTSVPINISMSPVMLRRYDVDVADEDLVLHDVVISGPTDVIEQVRSGELAVGAVVQPTVDELEAEVDSLAVELDVPAGVTVESTVGRVPVEIRRRD